MGKTLFRDIGQNAARKAQQQGFVARIDQQHARGLAARQVPPFIGRRDALAALLARPIDQRPSAVLISEPVRRGVERGIFARFIEMLAGRHAPGNVQHAGMGDDKQRLAGMRLGDFRQRGAHSGGEAH